MSNISAQNAFINTIIGLVEERGAHGIHLDFEGIAADKSDDFLNFITDLYFRVKEANKDFIISLAIPPFDFEKVYDIAKLNRYIDLFVMASYEFYGANSKVAGPISQVTGGVNWSEYSLDRALQEYIALGIDVNKLLLVIPYYGAEWRAEESQYPSKANGFTKYAMYRDIKYKVKDSYQVDDESMSSFYIRRHQNGKDYRQIWYDDSLSLAKKYDWVIEKQLKGVAIWALGYDNGHTDLWEALAEKFAKAPLKKSGTKITRGFFSRIMFMAMRVLRDPSQILRNPRMLLGSLGVFFGLSMVGFFIIFRYGCRLSRFINILLKSTIALIILLIVVFFIVAIKIAQYQSAVYIIVGFLVGGIVFFILNRRFLADKDVP